MPELHDDLEQSLLYQAWKIDTAAHKAYLRIDNHVADLNRKANYKALQRELGRDPKISDMLERTSEIFTTVSEAFTQLGSAFMGSSEAFEKNFRSLKTQRELFFTQKVRTDTSFFSPTDEFTP